MEALRGNDDSLRHTARVGLARMRPEDQAAVAPTIIEWIREKDWQVRETAAKSLGALGPEVKTAIPALTGMLGDKDSSVREAAVQALKEMGPDAKPAVPALKQRLRDDDWAVRDAARSAVEDIESNREYVRNFWVP
jgi:HEAT repeat protein